MIHLVITVTVVFLVLLFNLFIATIMALSEGTSK